MRCIFASSNRKLKPVNKINVAELASLSKEEILELLQNVLSELHKLQAIVVKDPNQFSERLSLLSKLLFGQKKDVFKNKDNGQLELFPSSNEDGVTSEDLQIIDNKINELSKEIDRQTATQSEEKPTAQHISDTPANPVKKKSRIESLLRNSVLERKTTYLEVPDAVKENMVLVKEVVTEKIDRVSAKFFIHKIVQPIYAPKDGGSFVKPDYPEDQIEQATITPAFMSEIVSLKCEHHLPIDRMNKMFVTEGLKTSVNNIYNWFSSSVSHLEPLYASLVSMTLSQSYLQADESPIRLNGEGAKGKCHRGYMWYFNSPSSPFCFMKYGNGRGFNELEPVLRNFTGCLQSDGYSVYNKYAVETKNKVTLFRCWAHARRNFINAEDNHPEIAIKAVKIIDQLYKVEADCRKHKDQFKTDDEYYTYRQKQREKLSKPLIELLLKLLENTKSLVTPGLKIEQAIQYLLSDWNMFTNYLDNGKVEIDNNLVENLVRPLAIGRKNYLFAYKQMNAQLLAVAYSFMLSCKKADVNFKEWLTDVLPKIARVKKSEYINLLPHNWKIARTPAHVSDNT